MSSSARCPNCGEPAPAGAWEGLCPRCIIRISVAPEPVATVFSQARDTGCSKAPARIGDYEILSEIGHGGMGIVYRARQLTLGRIVALKVLSAGRFASPRLIDRFRAEAAAIAQLQHPNIVPVFEVGEDDGLRYFSMPHVEGASLAELARDRPLAPNRAAAYAKQISEAIHFAHEQGVLHRDLKPSNVLIDLFDQVRVTDFGLAKRQSEETELTLTGQILGTPGYLPPEQLSAKHGSSGPHSDIYALGAILYYLLTGRPPFAAPTIEETLLLVIDGDPAPPRLLNPTVPGELETICLKCLEKEPGRRYARAKDVAEELGRFLRGEPILAQPIAGLTKVWRWCGRNPAWAALVFVSVGALFLIAGVVALAAARVAEKDRVVRQNGYVADMHLARQAIEDKNFGRAVDLLERHRPGPGQKDLRGWEWRYFSGACQSDELLTLGTHSNAVTCLAFSADGQRLFSGSLDGEVRAWDVPGRKIQARAALSNRVDALALDQKGFLAVGSHAGSIRFLAVETLTDAMVSIEIKERILALKFLEGGKRIAAILRRGAVKRCGLVVWDLASREAVHCGEMNAWLIAAFSPHDQMLAAGFNNGEIKVWDFPSGRLAATLTNHTSNISALTFSPDNRWLASGSYDRSARLWDLEKGTEIASFASHSGALQAVAFSPDSQRLATTSRDQTVKLWELGARRETVTLNGHWAGVSAATFSPDGFLLATGSQDGQIKFWESNPKPKPATSVNFPPDTMSFALSTDGAVLLRLIPNLNGQGSLSFDLWSMRDLSRIRTIQHGLTNHATAALSAGGQFVALGGWDGPIKVFKAQEPESALDLPATAAVHRVAFSPDSQFLAAAMDNRSLQVWRFANRELIATFPNSPGYAYALAFSKDGSVLAAGFEDGTTDIWDIYRKHRIGTFKGKLATTAVSIRPDGQGVVAANRDGSLHFWDLTGKTGLTTARGGAHALLSIGISPDGRRLAAGTYEGTVRVWDLVTHQEVASLGRHRDPAVVAVSFLPDGDNLASVSVDSLLLWRALPETRRSTSPR